MSAILILALALEIRSQISHLALIRQYNSIDLHSTTTLSPQQSTFSFDEMADSEDVLRQAPQVPFSIDLRTSSAICSITGNPPFTAVTIYTCNRERTIWALISLFSDFADYVIVRNLNHWKGRDRRIGCFPKMQAEWDEEEEVEFEVSKLERLEPGEIFETKYTFFVNPKPDTTRHSDVQFMKEGGKYFVEVSARKCWWMCVEEMREDFTEKEKRDLLRQRGAVQWNPPYRVDFTAVA